MIIIYRNFKFYCLKEVFIYLKCHIGSCQIGREGTIYWFNWEVFLILCPSHVEELSFELRLETPLSITTFFLF